MAKTVQDLLKAAREEVGRLRERDVQAVVTRRIDHRDGDATTGQIQMWEAEAYRQWREQWPALNNLLIPHGDLSGAAAGTGR